MSVSQHIADTIRHHYLRDGKPVTPFVISTTLRCPIADVLNLLALGAPEGTEKEGAGYSLTKDALRGIIDDMRDDAMERAEAADRSDD